MAEEEAEGGADGGAEDDDDDHPEEQAQQTGPALPSGVPGLRNVTVCLSCIACCHGVSSVSCVPRCLLSRIAIFCLFGHTCPQQGVGATHKRLLLTV